MVDSSREGFLKWVRPRYSPECFRVSPKGKFFDLGVQSDFETWQASRSAAIEECAVLAKKMHGCEKESGCDFADASRALKGEG